VDDLAALVGHYDTVKADQEAELRDFARKQNLDEEKIVNEHLGSLMITMDIEFN
jgi:predicted subunit of tRNA(5-methylaminomethyl-2-thiouridylate) methyltransferase